MKPASLIRRFGGLKLGAALLILAALPAAAATATWGGLGADANWLTGANWSGGSGTSGAAAAGDTLSFAGTTRTSPVNNFAADTSFAGINFPNTTAGQSFSLSGNRILLGGNMTTTASSGAGITDTIANDLLIQASRTVTGASKHTIALTGNITFNTGSSFSLQLANYEYAALNGAGGAINFNIAAGLTYNDYSGAQPATVTLSRAINANALMRITANSPSVIYNGTFTGSANTLTLQGVSTACDFQSAISAANAVIDKEQAGTWTLSGLYSSACTGTPITVASGTLTLNNDANSFTSGAANAVIYSPATLTVTSLKNYGVNCALGASASGLLYMGTGAGNAVLNYIGAGDSCNRKIQMGNQNTSTGGTMVQNNGANGGSGLRFTATAFNTPVTSSTANRTLTLGGANTDANEISGVIADNTASTGLVGLTKADAGNWKLSGPNTYSGGTTISGGILTANVAQTGTTSGPLGASGNIVFGGGTLQFTSLSAGWDPSARIAAGTSGSAVSINVNGQTGITFGTALTASQSGGLTLSDSTGGGKLTLNQTEAYTGNTTVNAGTLYVSGSLAAGSAVTVDGTASGTLGGSGTINGTVTLQNGGILQPSTSGSVNTLTLANATAPTFNAGSKLKIRVPTSTTADQVALSSATPVFDPANLDLIIDTTGLTGNPSGLTIVSAAKGNSGISANPFHSVTVTGNAGDPVTVHYNTSAGTITVDLVSYHTLSYNSNGGTGTDPGSSSIQDGSSVTTAANPYTKSSSTFVGWNTAANGSGTFVAAGASFTMPAANTTLYAQWMANNAGTGFNQTAAGPWDYNTATNWVSDTINGIWDSSLTLTAGQTVTFAADTTLSTGLTFNQAGNFALKLKAAAAGTNNLTLGGDIGLNTSGGTSANVTLGDSANHLNVNLGGATRTVTVAASRTLTLNDVVSNGGITKAGAGTLTLSGANTYSGTTYINAGTVNLATSTNAFGTGTIYLGATSGSANATLLNSYWNYYAGVTNPIVVQAGSSGTLLLQNPVNQASSFSGLITLSNTLTLDAGNGSGGVMVFHGSFTGASNVVVNCSSPGGVVQFAGGTSTNFSGTVQVVNGTLNVNGGNLTVSNIVQVYAGATNTFLFGESIAGLNDNAGAGGVVNNAYIVPATLVLGGSGTYSFNGTIQDNVTNLAVTVTRGKHTFGGTNTYSGATTISGGTLALSGSALITNTASIVVASNAVFDVFGLGSVFSLGASQTLSNSAPGAIINGTNNCSAGTLSLVYDGVNPALTITNGGMTLSGATTFKVNKNGAALMPGTYKIIAKATVGNVGLLAGAVPSSVAVVGGPSAGTPALSIVNGELYLTVGGISTVGYTGGPFTYNGSGQSPTISFSGSNGLKTTNYAGVSGTTYGPSAFAPVNAGSYYVSNVVAADANYFGSTNSQSFTIGVASASVTADAKTKTYGNVNPVLTATVVGQVVGGDAINYSLSTDASQFSSVGVSNIFVNLGSNPNYSLLTTNGTLTIYQANTFVGASSTKNPSGYKDTVAYIATLPSDATGSVVFSSTNGPIRRTP